MKCCHVFGIAVVMLVATTAGTPADENSAAAALESIGWVTRDSKQPGNPVTEVLITHGHVSQDVISL